MTFGRYFTVGLPGTWAGDMTREIATIADQAAEFRLLGGVELEVRGTRQDLGPAQERRLLVVLLAARGLYQRMLHGDPSVLRPEAIRFSATPTPHVSPAPPDDQQQLEKDGESTMTWEHFTNTAQDHAQVGIQAGKVNGSIHHSWVHRASTRAGIRDGLNEVYRTLAASARRGELEAAVFAAAEQELDLATVHLTDSGEAGRRALLLVLGRLRKLLAATYQDQDMAIKLAGLVDLAEEMR